jgi:predicted transcriptional regulator
MSTHYAIHINIMKQAEEKTEALSLRIPTWLKAALQDLADADRRQLSQYVRLALEVHVESKRQQQTETGTKVRLKRSADQNETEGKPARR